MMKMKMKMKKKRQKWKKKKKRKKKRNCVSVSRQRSVEDVRKGGLDKQNLVRDRKIKKSFMKMFEPTASYKLEIWFLAPFDPQRFRQTCLNVFTHLMNESAPLQTIQRQTGGFIP